MKHPPKSSNVPPTPELHFGVDNLDDDLISLNSMDLQSLELAVNDLADSSKSSINAGLTSPDMITPNFAKKIAEITKGSDPVNTTKSVLEKKKITTETHIHPQHHAAKSQQPQKLQEPQQPQHPHLPQQSQPKRAVTTIQVTSSNHVLSPLDAVTSPEFSVLSLCVSVYRYTTCEAVD